MQLGVSSGRPLASLHTLTKEPAHPRLPRVRRFTFSFSHFLVPAFSFLLIYLKTENKDGFFNFFFLPQTPPAQKEKGLRFHLCSSENEFDQWSRLFFCSLFMNANADAASRHLEIGKIKKIKSPPG